MLGLAVVVEMDGQARDSKLISGLPVLGDIGE
jgi:hypothetical protein